MLDKLGTYEKQGFELIPLDQSFKGSENEPEKIDWIKKFCPQWSWSENLKVTQIIIEV